MIITAGTATIWDHIKDYDKPTILHHYHEGVTYIYIILNRFYLIV